MDDQTRTIQKQGEQIRKLRKEVQSLIDENHNMAAVFRIEFENLRELMKSKIDTLHEEIDGLAEDIDYVKTKSASASRHLKSLAKGLKLPSEQFMSDTDNNFFRRTARHSRGRKPRKTEVYKSLEDLPRYTVPEISNSSYHYRQEFARRPQKSSSSSSDSGENTVENVDTGVNRSQSHGIQKMSVKENTSPKSQAVKTGPPVRHLSSSGSDTVRESVQPEQPQQESGSGRTVEVPVTNFTMGRSSEPVPIFTTATNNVETSVKPAPPISSSPAPVSISTANKSTSSVAMTTTTATLGSQNIKPLGNRESYGIHPIRLNFNDMESYMKSAHLEMTADTTQAIQQAFQRDDHTQTKPEGLYTILLVDTSQSMEGDPFTQVKRFLMDFIDEVENSAAYNNLEENVAVVTFGGDTSIKQRFTNDYGNIRDVVDRLQVGGRTPMFTALAMCVKYIKECGKTVQVTSALSLVPRVILITDGCVTDDNSFTGVDHEPYTIKCQSNVFTFLKATEQYGYPVIRVGVGEYNKPFLDDFPGHGVRAETSDVLYLARYYLYQTIVGQVVAENDERGGDGDIPNLVKNAVKECENFTNRDLDKIKELLQSHDIDFDGGEWYQEHEEEQSDGELLDEFGLNDKFARLLPIGTRVKRGQDWQWGDQDGNGPGTVVAHKDEGELVVKWDNGEMNVYFFKHDGVSHVRKCDAPRQLKPSEIIEVGCSVKRGRDWDRSDEDGGNGTVGVVIRKHRSNKVSVRWPSHVVETYSYGYDNKFEIEVVEDVENAANGTGAASLDGNSSARPQTGSSGQETEYAWQWQDESGQWRTLPKEEAAKLEDFYENKKTGTVMVNHYNTQLRCDPTKLVFRVQGGGDQKGEIRRVMFTKDELDNLNTLEIAMLQ